MGYRAVHVRSVVSWNFSPVSFSLFGITLNIPYRLLSSLLLI